MATLAILGSTLRSAQYALTGVPLNSSRSTLELAIKPCVLKNRFFELNIYLKKVSRIKNKSLTMRSQVHTEGIANVPFRVVVGCVLRYLMARLVWELM